MEELAKVLEALSALKVPTRSDTQNTEKYSARFSRKISSPRPDTSINSGIAKTQPSSRSTAVSSRKEASPQPPLSPGSCVNNSIINIKSQRVSTRAVSPHTVPSSYASNKQQRPTELLTKVTSAHASTTSSDEYAKTQMSTGLSGNSTLLQSLIPASSGCYKPSDCIHKCLTSSVSEPLPSVTVEDRATRDKYLQRKVSDFEIPKKKPRPPQKPLVLKKPSPHLFVIPGIAKSDLAEDEDVKWTQKRLTGPQREMMWASKPTSYDVKFPPLPKRLLESEGSIDKLRKSWVIPQVKQIETLKREFGLFPGLMVPNQLRNNYSVDIEDPNTTLNHENSDAEDTGGETYMMMMLMMMLMKYKTIAGLYFLLYVFHVNKK